MLVCGYMMIALVTIRDRSLIMGRGGGYKMGKLGVQNLLGLPSSQGETFRAPPPLLKGGNSLPPSPISMAKTSSSCVKTTSFLLCPSFSMAKTFSAPPPFFLVGIQLHLSPPPSRVVAPPLPAVSDHPLRDNNMAQAYIEFCLHHMVNWFIEREPYGIILVIIS